MFFNSEDFVEFLTTNKMNADQFMICYLLHTDVKNLYKYVSENKGFRKSDLEDLEDREFITMYNSRGRYIPDRYTIEEKFRRLLPSEDKWKAMANEIWDLYPTKGEINDGKIVFFKGINKLEFQDSYINNIINKSERKHKEIMRSLEEAVKCDMANMRIDKWFFGEIWKEIEFKDSDNYGQEEIT